MNINQSSDEQIAGACPFSGQLRIIHVEDSETDGEIISRKVAAEVSPVECVRVENREDLVTALSERPCDIVLCDHDLPAFDVEGALKVLRERDLDIPLIVVSGSIVEEEAVVSLLKKGAGDWISKDNLDRLVPAIKRELGEASLRKAKREADPAPVRKDRGLESNLRTLPLMREQSCRVGPRNTSDRNAMGRLEILLIADDPEVVEILNRFREREGHAVDRISTDFGGLREVLEHPYDVVIFDQILPGMRGAGIAGRIREMQGSGKTVMLTGIPDLVMEAAESIEGVDIILPHPLTCEALSEAVSSSRLSLPS